MTFSGMMISVRSFLINYLFEELIFISIRIFICCIFSLEEKYLAYRRVKTLYIRKKASSRGRRVKCGFHRMEVNRAEQKNEIQSGWMLNDVWKIARDIHSGHVPPH